MSWLRYVDKNVLSKVFCNSILEFRGLQNKGDIQILVPQICKAIFSSPWRYIFSLKIGEMKDLRKVSTSVFQVRILKLGKFIHIFEL